MCYFAYKGDLPIMQWLYVNYNARASSASSDDALQPATHCEVGPKQGDCVSNGQLPSIQRTADISDESAFVDRPSEGLNLQHSPCAAAEADKTDTSTPTTDRDNRDVYSDCANDANDDDALTADLDLGQVLFSFTPVVAAATAFDISDDGGQDCNDASPTALLAEQNLSELTALVSSTDQAYRSAEGLQMCRSFQIAVMKELEQLSAEEGDNGGRGDEEEQLAQLLELNESLLTGIAAAERALAGALRDTGASSGGSPRAAAQSVPSRRWNIDLAVGVEVRHKHHFNRFMKIDDAPEWESKLMFIIFLRVHLDMSLAVGHHDACAIHACSIYRPHLIDCLCLLSLFLLWSL